MAKEGEPLFIIVKDGKFHKVIFWNKASEEQRLLWLAEQETSNGGDSSARGDKPGANKGERRKTRGKTCH